MTPPPVGQFGCILADPPWALAMRSPKGEGRSAVRHYATMDLDAIKALPLTFTGAPDCVLLMWAIDPMLPQALEVIRAWGFTFKTVGFYWAKTNADGSPFMGSGYWTRSNPEQCLLATRGEPKRLRRDVRRLIVAPRREHSRKPDEQYARIERLVAGPYLELFARTARPGWTAWGNDVDRFAPSAGGGFSGEVLAERQHDQLVERAAEGGRVGLGALQQLAGDGDGKGDGLGHPPTLTRAPAGGER